MNPKYQTNGALLVGPVAKTSDLTAGAADRLGIMPENLAAWLTLVRVYRVRRHSDGWFVDGGRHRSQIWEYGAGKLGLTVIGPKFVNKARGMYWLTPRAVGEEEANFWCQWTDENVKLLEKFARLQKRKSLSEASHGNM